MWARVEPVLPPLKGLMGRPMTPHRLLVEGAIYRLRTGIAWRDLPEEFGPWQTVWKRHARLCKEGIGTRFCLPCRSKPMPTARSTGTCRSTPPLPVFISTGRVLAGLS